MSELDRNLLTAVLELPESERFAIVDAVIDKKLEMDDGSLKELDRRRIEHESGNDPGEPADLLFERLLVKRQKRENAAKGEPKK